MRVLGFDGTPHEIMEEDILYFSSHRNTICVHTAEAEFVMPVSLSELLAAYGPVGYERLDRSNVVNTTKIASYDEARKAVMFQDAPECYAPVSEPNEGRLKKLLDKRCREKA